MQLCILFDDTFSCFMFFFSPFFILMDTLPILSWAQQKRILNRLHWMISKTFSVYNFVSVESVSLLFVVVVVDVGEWVRMFVPWCANEGKYFFSHSFFLADLDWLATSHNIFVQWLVRVQCAYAFQSNRHKNAES